DEDLAREALSRRQMQLDSTANLNRQLGIQAEAIEKLYTSMQALEQKIVDAKRQKEALIARARTAKTSMQVNDMISTLKTSSSMEVFERMKEKVESLETQAQVAGEMAVSSSGSSVGLEERFRALEGSSQITDELEKMKRQLSGSKRIIDIPALPTTSSPRIDEEYEKLKREIRGRN
ncbi:PspA/IM30 family protein, partial [archaeon]